MHRMVAKDGRRGWFRSPVEEVSREDVALRWNVMMTQVFDFLFYGVFECMQQLHAFFIGNITIREVKQFTINTKILDDGLYLLGLVTTCHVLKLLQALEQLDGTQVKDIFKKQSRKEQKVKRVMDTNR